MLFNIDKIKSEKKLLQEQVEELEEGFIPTWPMKVHVSFPNFKLNAWASILGPMSDLSSVIVNIFSLIILIYV